jgi:hypothetical protein
MIHELRVFHCVPGRLPALLSRFENGTLRLFEKLKFGAFLKDPEWLDVRRKSQEDGPVEASITNTILVPTTFSMLR